MPPVWSIVERHIVISCVNATALLTCAMDHATLTPMLPGIAPGDGEAGLTDLAAFGDITGDDVPEAAVVAYCNAGGVAWPEYVLVYSSGPTLLGSVNLADLTTFPERATVSTISYAGGCFDIAGSSTRRGDPGCCGTLDVTASVVFDGQVEATDVQLHDETQLLQALSGGRRPGRRVRGAVRSRRRHQLGDVDGRHISPSLDGYTCFGALDAPFVLPGQAGAVDAERAVRFQRIPAEPGPGRLR